MPSLLTVNFYFKKRRSLASGLCICGNALGGFIVPTFMQYLVSEYAFSGSMMIFSGVALHVLACGLLMRPLNPPPKQISCCKEDTENIHSKGHIVNEKKLTSKDSSLKSSATKPKDFSSAEISHPQTGEDGDKDIEKQIVASHSNSESMKLEPFTSNFHENECISSQNKALQSTGLDTLSEKNKDELKNPEVKPLLHKKEEQIKHPRCVALQIEANENSRQRSVSESAWKPLNPKQLNESSSVAELRNRRLRSITGVDSKVFSSASSIISTGDTEVSVLMIEEENKKLASSKANLRKSSLSANEVGSEVAINDASKPNPEDKARATTCFKSFANYFDLEVLKKPRMIFKVISSFFAAIATPIILSFLHAHFRLVISYLIYLSFFKRQLSFVVLFIRNTRNLFCCS